MKPSRAREERKNQQMIANSQDQIARYNSIIPSTKEKERSRDVKSFENLSINDEDTEKLEAYLLKRKKDIEDKMRALEQGDPEVTQTIEKEMYVKENLKLAIPEKSQYIGQQASGTLSVAQADHLKPFQSTEHDRERRLKLREEERLLRQARNQNSVYEVSNNKVFSNFHGNREEQIGQIISNPKFSQPRLSPNKQQYDISPVIPQKNSDPRNFSKQAYEDQSFSDNFNAKFQNFFQAPEKNETLSQDVKPLPKNSQQIVSKNPLNENEPNSSNDMKLPGYRGSIEQYNDKIERQRIYKEMLDGQLKEKNGIISQHIHQSTDKGHILSEPGKKIENNFLESHEKKREYADQLMKQIVENEKRRGLEQNQRIDENPFMSGQNIQRQMQPSQNDIQKLIEMEKRRKYKEELDNQVSEKQNQKQRDYSQEKFPKSKPSFTENPQNFPHRHSENYSNNRVYVQGNNRSVNEEQYSINENAQNGLNALSHAKLNASPHSREPLKRGRSELLKESSEDPPYSNKDVTVLSKMEDEEKKRKQKEKQQKQQIAEELRKQMQEKEEKKKLEKKQIQEEELREMEKFEREQKLIQQRDREREQLKKRQISTENNLLGPPPQNNLVEKNLIEDPQNLQHRLGNEEQPFRQEPLLNDKKCKEDNSSSSMNQVQELSEYNPNPNQQSSPKYDRNPYFQGQFPQFPGPLPQEQLVGEYPNIYAQFQQFYPQDRAQLPEFGNLHMPPPFYFNPYMHPFHPFFLPPQHPMANFYQPTQQDLSRFKGMLQDIEEQRNRKDHLAQEKHRLESKLSEIQKEKIQYQREIEKLRTMLEKDPKLQDQLIESILYHSQTDPNAHRNAIIASQILGPEKLYKIPLQVQASNIHQLGGIADFEKNKKQEFKTPGNFISPKRGDDRFHINNSLLVKMPNESALSMKSLVAESYLLDQNNNELEMSFLKDLEAFKELHSQAFHLNSPLNEHVQETPSSIRYGAIKETSIAGSENAGGYSNQNLDRTKNFRSQVVAGADKNHKETVIQAEMTNLNKILTFHPSNNTVEEKLSIQGERAATGLRSSQQAGHQFKTSEQINNFMSPKDEIGRKDYTSLSEARELGSIFPTSTNRTEFYHELRGLQGFSNLSNRNDPNDPANRPVTLKNYNIGELYSEREIMFGQNVKLSDFHTNDVSRNASSRIESPFKEQVDPFLVDKETYKKEVKMQDMKSDRSLVIADEDDYEYENQNVSQDKGLEELREQLNFRSRYPKNSIEGSGSKQSSSLQKSYPSNADDQQAISSILAPQEIFSQQFHQKKVEGVSEKASLSVKKSQVMIPSNREGNQIISSDSSVVSKLGLLKKDRSQGKLEPSDSIVPEKKEELKEIVSSPIKNSYYSIKEDPNMENLFSDYKYHEDKLDSQIKLDEKIPVSNNIDKITSSPLKSPRSSSNKHVHSCLQKDTNKNLELSVSDKHSKDVLLVRNPFESKAFEPLKRNHSLENDLADFSHNHRDPSELQFSENKRVTNDLRHEQISEKEIENHPNYGNINYNPSNSENSWHSSNLGVERNKNRKIKTIDPFARVSEPNMSITERVQPHIKEEERKDFIQDQIGLIGIDSNGPRTSADSKYVSNKERSQMILDRLTNLLGNLGGDFNIETGSAENTQYFQGEGAYERINENVNVAK